MSDAQSESPSEESGSDMSEETPPGRRANSTATSGGVSKSQSINLSRSLNTTAGGKSSFNTSRKSAMTPDEKKAHKDIVSDKYFKLMEKYGPKRRFLQEKNSTVVDGEEVGPVDPVGFVIKFRLSHAYKALEKQEIEAAVPDIKPVRKRKRTKFLLPDERRSEVDTLIVGPNDSVTDRPSSATTAATTARSKATRRVQIRLRASDKENTGTHQGATGSGKKGVWQALTEQKATTAVKLKEKQQREDNLKAAAGKGQQNQGKGQTQAKSGNHKQTNQKQSSQKQQTNQKHGNQRQTNQKQVQNNKGKADPKGGQNSKGGKGKVKTEAEIQQEKQRAIEQSLAKLRANTRQHRDRRSREMWDSHFQGIGGMGLPGSVGATDYSFGAGDSGFRMFSDTGFSGSITMDAITVTGSRPSSPSKSLISGTRSRPSSGRMGSESPKPRTSTPFGGRAASPMRPHTARSRTPAGNSQIADRRRAQSATPGGKDAIKDKSGKSITAILRMDRKPGGKDGKDGAKEGQDNKIMAPRKISKYLYHMCNCHQVARKETLSKLYKKKSFSGVIDVFGCPDTRDDRATVLACPFCKTVPQRRINTWLDNLEDF